ncbi:antiviral reverse transcriptase Drt3a [Rhodococcus sp. RCBS9]|uniref:antiviral reverse transcriptase Drt3a n=1 Tax=Rhodococcus sp. RCBS9 TaxID=3031999 RepID=UPI0024027391|nr:antiviral reverse transcriptase Drt3a [Rhodococcus sp. RCBS9]WEX04283.1 RNA-directed DNA polymerase [Rhodococcus sp. RCBS9]
MDQRFSVENFRRLWDLRTRRGEDLTNFFPKFAEAAQDLKNLSRSTKYQIDQFPLGSKEREAEHKRLKNLRNEKSNLKENTLNEALKEVCVKIDSKINNSDFSLSLERGSIILGKQTYRIRINEPENYFIARQIEENLKNSFSLVLPNRQNLAEQVLLSLDDKTKKLIVRTDLRKFYESIPHEELIGLLHNSPSLSRTSCRFIDSLLEEYRNLSGTQKGIPRGLGISSMLAEVYLSQLDNTLKRHEGLRLYVRYVDDIVMVFNSGHHHRPKEERQAKIRSDIRNLNLSMNASKTRYIETSKLGGDIKKFSFLGYEYSLSENNAKVDISNSRVARYRRRLDLSFSSFNSNPGSGSAISTLHDRIKFLTSNTRLSNNKRHALTGVYFSNSLLSETSNKINSLDATYQKMLEKNSIPPEWLERMRSLSFANGFESKTFHSFSGKKLSKIVKVWKYDEKS